MTDLRALVVSGGRDLEGPEDEAFVRQALYTLCQQLWGSPGRGPAHGEATPRLVIHGACGLSVGDPIVVAKMRGADRIAHEWAADVEATPCPMPADWYSGRASGPRRNRAMAMIALNMLNCGWDVHLAAFPTGGTGTAGMIFEWQHRITDRLHVFARQAGR